jgi:competence ComEA-like helix-hairpin-helix protein
MMMDEHKILVNLNKAGREELMTLPGVGPAIADRIIASRPFATIADLQRVSGIGLNLVEGIQEMVTVNNDNSATGLPVEAASLEVANAASQEAFADISLPEPTPQAEPELSIQAQPPVVSEETEVMEKLPEEAPPPGIFEQVERQPIASGEETIVAEAKEELPEEAPPPGVFVQAAAQPQASMAEEALKPAAESEGEANVYAAPEGQTTGPQAEFAPNVQPTASAAQPAAVTRSQAWWMAIGTGFLSLILALILSLGVLAAINGGLRFVSPADLNALGRKVDGVTTQTQLLQQDLDGLRTRVNNLEGLSGRVSSVEGQAKQLRTDLDAASQQVQQINQQMTQVSSDIKDLQTQTGRFQGFLDGLKSLLNQVSQP